jgi:hypothetical protein
VRLRERLRAREQGFLAGVAADGRQEPKLLER